MQLRASSRKDEGIFKRASIPLINETRLYMHTTQLRLFELYAFIYYTILSCPIELQETLLLITDIGIDIFLDAPQ